MVNILHAFEGIDGAHHERRREFKTAVGTARWPLGFRPGHTPSPPGEESVHSIRNVDTKMASRRFEFVWRRLAAYTRVLKP